MSISIDRYQELMTLPICAFNGLNNPDELQRYECSTIWKQSDRDNLANYIEQAQTMREVELGYFLTPTYTVGELGRMINNPHTLKNKYLIALGTLATADIDDDVILTHEDGGEIVDPVVITLSTSVTDVGEIRIYKQDSNGTEYLVTPSYMRISGGTLTIHIPRARLVNPDLLDDRDDHLEYVDTDNFVESVVVRREYTDPAGAVEYFWNACGTFTESVQAGYGKIINSKISLIEAFPANWDGIVATPATTFCFRYPTNVRFSYLSGRPSNKLLDTQTIRLAHTLMPFEPCTCEPVHQYWIADTEIDPNRLTTPYGRSKAAVDVWLADSRSKIGFGTTVSLK